MANTKRKKEENKSKVIEILAFAALVVIIVVVVIVAIVQSSSQLNDNYFVSDETKLVLTVDTEAMGITSEAENSPVKAHVVYTYQDDAITGMTLYYVFEDNDTAKAAYDLMIEEDAETYSEAKVDGKYIIIPAEESDYADLTVEEVKQNIEMMEMVYSDAEETTETTEEATE